MKILITGSSGLIGQALTKHYSHSSAQLLLTTRKEPKTSEQVKWSAEEGFAPADLERIEGVDVVIHLAGESVFGIRWSEEKKAAIRDSRVRGTKSVVDAIASLATKPSVFISASAIGYYGDRDDEILTEASPAGNTFLSEVCREWEAESRRAEDLGVRTVLLRNGIVLSKEGGALATMILPFKFGLGGVIGSGKQWMSWISIKDVVRIIDFAIKNEQVRGAINVTAPNPVTNAEFTETLGKVLYRPTIMPLPEFAVHMLMGEMGDALLLDSTRVIPKRLADSGFVFKYPELKTALEEELK